MTQTEEYFLRLQNGNDVRGAAIATDTETKTLTPGLVTFICAAFGKFLAERTGKPAGALRIGVGHDSRITAGPLKEACFRGLSFSSVYDCGLISTPAMFQSTVLPDSGFDGTVMITASHLPFNRNGLKFFTRDGGLEKKELASVLTEAAVLAGQYGRPDEEDFISCEALPRGENAPLDFDMVSVYSEKMKELIRNEVKAEDEAHPLTGLHIVVDAGNGAAGFFASRILAPLGADTSGSVFLEPDGTFPNHIPNPENPDAMNAARKATLDAGADLGVIFDCDGDRGAVVFADGTEVNRNRLIALLAVIVSESHPGSTIVTDSVTSDELHAFLEDRLGLKHFRYRRGYKNVIDKGIELNASGTDCELAIETSGHGAFRENFFSDDGAYISVKIICEMAKLRREGRNIESLIADLGQPAESEEIRFHISDPDFRAVGEETLKAFRAFAEKDDRFHIVEPNYEGIRISFSDEEVRGWLLLRMSLHDPVLPLNIEAERKGGVGVILGRIAPFFSARKNLTPDRAF